MISYARQRPAAIAAPGRRIEALAWPTDSPQARFS